MPPRIESNAEIAKAIKALKEREREALSLFRPTPTQESFFRSHAHQRLLRGGNRCLSGDQQVFDPVDGGLRRVDEIDGEFHVPSVNPDTGAVETKRASRPFVKGYGALYRVTFSTGETLGCTLHHRVVDSSGRWVSVEQAVLSGVLLASFAASVPPHAGVAFLPRSSSGISQPTSHEGGLHCWRTALGSQWSCSSRLHPCGELLLQAQGIGQGASPSQDGAQGHTFPTWRSGGVVGSEECIHVCRSSRRPSILDAHLQALAPCFGWVYHSDVESSLRSGGTPHRPPQSVQWSSVDLYTVPQDHPSVFDSASHPQGFVVGNKSSYCHIVSCEEIGWGPIWDFTVEDFSNYVAGGVVNANSGKSISAAVLFASAVTGTQLYDLNGNPFPRLFPADRRITAWIVGYDERHIGMTIYPKLFESGPQSPRMIRDAKTGVWRAWRPWEQEDADRERETKPCPPLIPDRLVDKKEIAWDGKVGRIFNLARLANGNEIHAFSSKGSAGQGVAVDLIWIDEDIYNPRHVSEWQARLADNHGYLIWSAWPHSANDALVAMSKRAEEEKALPDPGVTETLLTFSGNPYIPKKAKDEITRSWAAAGPDELRARDRGEFTFDSVLVFPSFSTQVHGIEIRDKAPANHRFNDPLEQVLFEYNYTIPADWTSYLVLDPGHTQPAVIFCAVPPPEIGDYVLQYDEVFIPRIDAMELARHVSGKAAGKTFQAFLMDAHAGRQSVMGLGKTYRDIYTEAFEKYKIFSATTGNSFLWGSDNIQARNEIIRGWLALRPNGTPRYRILHERCPGTVRQFGLYKKKVSKDWTSEDTVEKNNDCMACLGYLSAYNPGYVSISPDQMIRSPGLDAYKSWKSRRDDRDKKDDTVFVGAGTR